MSWNSQQLTLTLSRIWTEPGETKGKASCQAHGSLQLCQSSSASDNRHFSGVTEKHIWHRSLQTKAENPQSGLSLNKTKTTRGEVGTGQQIFSVSVCTIEITGVHYTNLYLNTGYWNHRDSFVIQQQSARELQASLKKQFPANSPSASCVADVGRNAIYGAGESVSP